MAMTSSSSSSSSDEERHNSSNNVNVSSIKALSEIDQSKTETLASTINGSIKWEKMNITISGDNDKKSIRNGRIEIVKSLLGRTPVLLVSILIFVLLCGACLSIVFTISKAQKDAKAEDATDLALETGQYFSDQLEQAILPLFSMAQFATNLELFYDLPDKIGMAGQSGALPFLPNEDDDDERVFRNVTGVCDDPRTVSKFVTIATAIKEQSRMDKILVNLQLAPAGVVCLLHPMNNTEDFEDGKFLDNTGAWGLDLLNDPVMKYIALESVEKDDVVIAGPRPLVQCPSCGDFFIARLPIVDQNHEIIGLDGVAYPRWGFATALIDWTRMVDQSGIHRSFEEGHGGVGASYDAFDFRLTRMDRIYNETTDTYDETVVILAESDYYSKSLPSHRHSQVMVPLQTTNSQWEMHVRYDESDIMLWTGIVATVCIVLSFLISWLIYTVLIQKQMHADMQANTSAQEAKVETERNMTAYFAHELRNPLSAIDSALYAIAEDELPKAPRELIQGMKLCSSFMSSIMNNLLDARKLQEGLMEIRSYPISLSEVVNDVYKMMHPLAKTGVELKMENKVPAKMDWVLADKRRIEQVLTNMITNAIKYTATGSITIRVSLSEDKQVCFEVDDTGPGIPKSEQDRLFERFVQRGGAPGTGLGLAISKQIVTMMNGTIYFDSDPTVRPGTNCIVLLPLEMCAPVEEDSTQMTFNPVKPIEDAVSFLIMDDVKMNRIMLQRRIKKAVAPNAEIFMAVNGEEALELVKERHFDIIICDQYMEESGGVLVGTDVIIAMRRNGVKSLVVGCSGNDLQEEFRNAGADIIWGKPMPSNEEIIHQLRRGLHDRDLI